MEWAQKSGLWKPKGTSTKSSNDKPEFNFGIAALDDLQGWAFRDNNRGPEQLILRGTNRGPIAAHRGPMTVKPAGQAYLKLYFYIKT